MTFSVHRTNLLAALDAAHRIAPKRTTIPILGNIRLSAEGGHLKVMATDLDIEVTAETELAQDGAADFTVSAELAREFVRKQPEAAEIKFVVDKATASISAGRSRATLNILPAEDFPSFSSGNFAARFAIPAGQLLRLLGTCAFAMSSEETRHYLNGIFLHTPQDTGTLRAVATDGHRLARCEVPLPEGAADMPSVIVPKRMVAELLKMLTGLKGEAAKSDIVLEVSETKIRATMPGGEVIISKLVDGTFPDYQRVIPSRNENSFSLDAKAFAAAVDRVITVAGERGRSIRFTWGEDSVALHCANPDAGEMSEQCDIVKAEGQPLEIGFNGRYCLDLLAQLGGGQMTIAMDNPGAPALITGADENALFVLMPMRA